MIESGYANAVKHSEAQAVRELQVTNEFRRLMGAIENAQRAATEICERMTPVSRGDNPTTGIEKNPPEEVLCPLADQIRNARRAVDQVSGQLDYQRSKLEV